MKLFPIRIALKYFLIALSIFYIFTSVFSQSLVINEVSQGPSGNKEYVEFLVVPGAGPYQCSNYCLDLRGWIIDDNNGYFSGGPTSGVGIANGAVRFKNDPFWQCIPIGTILVIYNDLDLNISLPPNDLSLTDGNCRLIIPVSSTLLEHETTSPTTTSSTYPTTGWNVGGIWGPISMANGGDSFQIYNSSTQSTPAHGVSWANNTTNTIIYFAPSATNSVFYFANTISNNPSDQSNWVAGTCSAPNDQTPGLPNNLANATYISSLTNNCAGPIQASLISSNDANSCQCDGTASVNVSGSIPNYSYNWFNTSNVSIGQFTSTATALCQGSYYCIVTSSINCADTVYVTINSSSSTISPTFNPIAPICSGGNINLPSTSTNGITGSWSPSIDNTQSTTYTFTPSTGQCANSTSLTVQVLNTITPTFNQLGPFCQGATAPTFSNTSLEGISGVWGPPGINTGAVGTNTYVFVTNSGQCATNQTMTITVNPYLTPIFPVQDPICFGENLVLPSLSTNGINGSWSPSFNSTNTTTYTFTPVNGQCSANTTMTVEVLSISPIEAGNNITICEGSYIQLSATGGIQYSWSGGIQNNLLFQPSQTEIYYVIGTDVNGCQATDSVTVILIPIPNAQFTTDVNSGTAPLTVNFTNSSSNSTNYNWNFGDGNENSSLDLSNVSNTFSIPGSYTVWLVASNGFCSDSIMTVINVLSAGAPEIEIPNVFTPNGDNTNEEWIIQTTNIASIEVIILNRWGNVMAEINDVATGWNGKTTNGDDATDGTYFYKYTAKALNGENLTGQGFLTLLR